MKKLIAVAIAVALIGTGAAVTVTMLNAQTPGPTNRTVRTIGNNTFAANARISSNLRFLPGDIRIKSGGVLTLRHMDKTSEPHTLSIIDADELPGSIDDVFNCGAPGTVCDDIFSSLGDGAVSEGPGTEPGLDGRLDTLWIEPGDSVNVVVSAPAKTELAYICAIHPWMQGRIIVMN